MTCGEVLAQRDAQFLRSLVVLGERTELALHELAGEALIPGGERQQGNVSVPDLVRAELATDAVGLACFPVADPEAFQALRNVAERHEEACWKTIHDRGLGPGFAQPSTAQPGPEGTCGTRNREIVQTVLRSQPGEDPVAFLCGRDCCEVYAGQ